MTAIEFSYHLVQLKDNLTRFAQSLTSDRDDAEDLFQETVYKALKYRDKYTSETNLRAWLYTIMKNTFINAYRRNLKARQYQELQVKTETPHSQSPISWHTEKEIQTAIDNLEESIRIPFQRYVDGYKYKEIAEEMNLPIGTVKSRIFNARKVLSTQLADLQYA